MRETEMVLDLWLRFDVHHYDLPASDSSFPAYFEVVNRRIAPLFKRTVDALHNYVMDLAALLESGFSQRLVDWFRYKLEWTMSGRGRRPAGALDVCYQRVIVSMQRQSLVRARGQLRLIRLDQASE
jgi:hypothetical protein